MLKWFALRVPARLELGTKPPVDTFGDATGGDFWVCLAQCLNNQSPRLACFGGGLGAKAFARNGHKGLGVDDALVVDDCGLGHLVAVYTGPICPLGADEVFDTYFVADDMDADPVFEIGPFPAEKQLADGGMLCQKNAPFPFGTRLFVAGLSADCCTRGICDLTPRGEALEEKKLRLALAFTGSLLKKALPASKQSQTAVAKRKRVVIVSG